MSRPQDRPVPRLELNVRDVLTFRAADLLNLAETLKFLPEGIGAMLNDRSVGTNERLSGLMHSMATHLQQIADDLSGLDEGRLPRWYRN